MEANQCTEVHHSDTITTSYTSERSYYKAIRARADRALGMKCLWSQREMERCDCTRPREAYAETSVGASWKFRWLCTRTHVTIVAFLQVQKCSAATQREAQESCLTDSWVPRAKVKYTVRPRLGRIWMEGVTVRPGIWTPKRGKYVKYEMSHCGEDPMMILEALRQRQLKGLD